MGLTKDVDDLIIGETTLWGVEFQSAIQQIDDLAKIKAAGEK